MKDGDKNLELSNSSFEVKIKWKSGLFSSQIAILLGLGALYVCSSSPGIRHFIFFCLALDVLAGVFTLVTSVKHSEEKEEVKLDEAAKEKPETAEVTHTKSGKSSVSKSDRQINRKVPVPNPNAARTHGSGAPAQQTEQVEPQPMAIPQPEMNPQPEQPAPSTSGQVETNDMSDEDWEGFF